METIRIEGGIPLEGRISVQGSKNAALPIMAAAILQEGVSVLEGCPRISDVFCMEKILQALGAETSWEGHTLTLDCRQIRTVQVPAGFAGQMRSSIMLMGSMLGRVGELTIAYPGGCTIGARPINWHLEILKEMGAVILEEGERLRAVCRKLKGGRIRLPFPSVGVTENGILAAVRAEGVTVLQGCAREPEIVHLCRFLQKMGAAVEGAGTSCIRIEGGRSLQGVRFEIPRDRIAAGTYLYAGAATRGYVELEGAPVEEMGAILEVYKKMGGQYTVNGVTLRTDSALVRRPLRGIQTAGYPGFPTDMQSPLLAVLCTVPGRSQICENIFEDRYKIVPELEKMGAEIEVCGRQVCIWGGKPLRGVCTAARELRGGAALALAALAARGTTAIGGWNFVERGYEDFPGQIRRLGGRMVREHR